MQIAPQSLLNEQCGNNFQTNHSPAALTDAGGGRTCTKTGRGREGPVALPEPEFCCAMVAFLDREIKLSPLARTQDAEVRCLVTHFFRSQEPFPRIYNPIGRAGAPVTAHAQTLPIGPRAPGRSFVTTECI